MADQPRSKTTREGGSEVLASRVALLIEQMGEELGSAHGWKKEVASRLGLHPSNISKILAGDRPIGMGTVESIAKRIGLNLRFFVDSFSDDFPPPHYTNYLLERTPPSPWQASTAALGARALDDLNETAYALLEEPSQGRPVDLEKARQLASEVNELAIVRIAREILRALEDDSANTALVGAAALGLAAFILESTGSHTDAKRATHLAGQSRPDGDRSKPD